MQGFEDARLARSRHVVMSLILTPCILTKSKQHPNESFSLTGSYLCHGTLLSAETGHGLLNKGLCHRHLSEAAVPGPGDAHLGFGLGQAPSNKT